MNTQQNDEPPADYRDLLTADFLRLCACGCQWREHYDGWDGNRLSCRETMRRTGREGRGEASEAAR